MADIKTTDVNIESGGEVLRGELVTPSWGMPHSLVVLLHGIPLSRPDPRDPGYALMARQLAENGFAALFVNFRGCGTSTGNFYLGGWYKDLTSIIYFVKTELTPEKTFIAGYSAGGSLAIKYVAENGVADGLATFAAPARLTKVFPPENVMQLIEAARDIGIIRDKDFPPSPRWFLEDAAGYEAIDYVRRVSPVPLLVVHGDDDELVPLRQGRELFEAAGQPKELVVLPKGEHRLRHDPRSMETLLAWLPK
jgi:uncharacterized protein